jgi:DNA-binding XRE family transcriptional regulator
MREMTQTELAAKVGISKSVIAAYEIGRAKPSLDNAIAIASVFGVHVEDLLELVEVPA